MNCIEICFYISNVNTHFGVAGKFVVGFNQFNLTYMYDYISVAKEDHSQHDCFSCTISSHGSRDHTRIGDNEYVEADIVYGRDGIVRMRLITEIFTDVQCPTLIGKPRIFMVQVRLQEAHDIF